MRRTPRAPRSFPKRAWRLLHDVRGATAVEYGLIVTLIVIAMIASLRGVADTTSAMWDDVSKKVIAAK